MDFHPGLALGSLGSAAAPSPCPSPASAALPTLLLLGALPPMQETLSLFNPLNYWQIPAANNPWLANALQTACGRRFALGGSFCVGCVRRAGGAASGSPLRLQLSECKSVWMETGEIWWSWGSCCGLLKGCGCGGGDVVIRSAGWCLWVWTLVHPCERDPSQDPTHREPASHSLALIPPVVTQGVTAPFWTYFLPCV